MHTINVSCSELPVSRGTSVPIIGSKAHTSRAGQAFHMNLTTHYRLDQTWGIGANGYYRQR